MNDETLESKSDARVSARRRLVRGVFAAPAALTLYSGGAVAASNQRCIVNQVTHPELIKPGSADTWVRVPEYSKGNLLLVKRDDLVAVQGTAGIATSLLGSPWWTVANPSSAYTPPGGSTPSPTGRYVAVRVDADGNIIGIISDAATESGSAISQTCWTSFSGIKFT